MKTIYIVIIGPDGCGKTSVALGLQANLRLLGHDVRLHEFLFGAMPSISSLFKLKKNKKINKSNFIGMVRPVSSFKAIVLSIWYGIDHLFGHYELFKKNKKIIIFARSYHDFLYQRVYKNLPIFFPKLFIALGPKPDFIFSLVRKSSDIIKQKQELTEFEINQQYLRIEKRMANYSNFKKIDCSIGLEKTIKLLSNIALKNI